MAKKKVSDLIEELGIGYDELKKMTQSLDIEIKTRESSIDQSDADRIVDTVSRLKGSRSSSGSSSKHKNKVMPILGKAMPRRKKKADIEAEEKAAEEKAAEEKAVEEAPQKPRDDAAGDSKAGETASVATEKSEKESVKEAKAPDDEKKAEESSEKAPEAKKTEENSAEKAGAPVSEKAPDVSSAQEKKAEAPAEEKPSGKAEDKAPSKAEERTGEKPSHASKKHDEKSGDKAADKTGDKAVEEKKEEKKEAKKEKEEYVNAPNKPMRFKKVFDVKKDSKPEEKKSSGKKSRDAKGKGKNENGGSKDRRDKNSSRRQSRSGEGRTDERRNEGAQAPQTSGKHSGKSGKTKKVFDKKERGDGSHERHNRFEKGNGGGKNSRYYDERTLEKQQRHKYKNKQKQQEPEESIEDLLPEGTIAITVPITVAGLAEQAEVSPSMVIMALMKLGIMATINQTLDKDTVEMLEEDLGISIAVTEEHEEEEEPGLELHEDAESELKPRAPIITVMGHVDHGKTSLLDAIRNTNVTEGESGGITQHIGASEVNINGKKIVFLDTPGHEAFTTMRARGAQITDIAVLVVAADDSVKPQTIESISHAKAANVPIIVAINKMDKPGANPDKVKKDLADNGVLVEDWGGDTICVPVSAKKGEGIHELLEMILLQAEMLELRANPDRLAMGSVIEARLDKARGPVATLLVMNGTLKTGQSIVAGTCHGKIRLMTNYKGDTIRKALPATPVEVLGLNDVPLAGDAFNAVKDDKTAREIAENRAEKMREEVLAKNSSTTLEKLFSQIKEGEVQNLNIIVKADVQGSVGAIITSLEKLNNDEVKVNIIHSGVGTVTESDVMLAETSGAIIIGFNVRPTTAVMNQASDANVEVRLYRVIYDIIDDVEKAMKGMLAPEFQEKVLGKAEIRETFKVPNIGIVGGAYVTEGKMQRNMQIRLVRDGIVIHEGMISSLRRFKDDVKEVNQGYECGIGIENYNDIKPGDVIECFTMVEVERDL